MEPHQQRHHYQGHDDGGGGGGGLPRPPHPSGHHRPPQLPPHHGLPPPPRPHPDGGHGHRQHHDQHHQHHHHHHNPQHGHHFHHQQQQHGHAPHGHPSSDDPNAPPAKWHSFKLLVDPHIHRDSPKMVRYDGSTVPGDPHHIPPVPCDPRKRMPSALWKRLEPMDLPVPRLKIDENYVGEPPKVEVTIENLNDNVDKQFLHNMIAKHGPYEEMHIYYHPAKRKHLGLARVVFEEVRSAKSCVDVLHGKSVMGKHLQCYLDPTGASCKKVFQDLTTEKKPEPQPPPPPPPLGDAAADGDDLDKSPKENSDKKSPEDSKWDRRRDSRDNRDPRGSVEHRKRLERRRSDHNSDPRERDRDRERDRGERHQRERDGERNNRDHEDFWRDGPLQSAHGHRVPPPPPVHWERGGEKSRGGGREERSSSFESYSQPPPPLPPPPPVLSSSSAQESHYAPTRFDPQYSQPDYWLQQAQHYAEQAARASMGATDDIADGGVSEVPDVSAALEDGIASNAAIVDVVEPKTEVKDETGEVKKEENADGAKAGSDEDGPKVDLDTRLKMLMKGPQTSMPAFLLQELNNSESDDEKGDDVAEEVKEEDEANAADAKSVFPLLPDELPLSRPPSPFLTAAHYLNCHKESVEERRRAREAEDKARGRSGRRLNGNRRPNSAGNSDKMSLSSLSSTEMEQGVTDVTAYPPPPYGYYPPPGMVMPPGYPGAAGDMHQPMYPDMYPGYGEYDPTMYYAQTGQYPPPGWAEMGQDSAMYTNRGPGKEARRDLVENCVEAVVEDLKRTLCKDVKKKIGETFAFYLYDQWWAEKEEKYKTEQRRKLESKKSEETEKASNAADAPVHITAESANNTVPLADNAAPAPSSNTSTPDKRADIPPAASQGGEAQPAAASTSNALDVTSFFNQQREKMDAGGGSSSMIASAFGKGGSLGFGFRGTIPKLPSFKIKKTAKRKDGRKSDGESSDDDDRSSHPGTSSGAGRRGSGKRREQEKRREQRLRDEREKQRRRKSNDSDGGGGRRERDKSKSKGRDRDDSRKEDKKGDASKDARKPGRTLESIYSQIYSDDGSDSDAGEKLGSKDLEISSGSDVPKKDAKRASADTKALRKGKRAATGSVSSAADDSSSSNSSTVRSSSAMSEVSSRTSASSSSSSSSEASASTSSGASSSSSSSSASESEAEDKANAAKSAVVKVVEEKPEEAQAVATVARKESSEEAEVDVEKEEAARPKPSPERKLDSSGTDSSDEVEKEAPAPTEPEFKEPAAKPAPVTPSPKKPEVKIPEESPPHIIDHCYARPYSEEGLESPKHKENQFQDQFALDHGYTRPRTPPAEQKKRALQEKQRVADEAAAAVPANRTAAGRKSSAGKAQKQPIVDETAPLKPIRGRTYKARTGQEQFEVVYKFLTKGLDLEDISYLKRSYHMMLNQNQAGQDKNLYWLNDTHWVDHTVTEIPSPPKSKRRRKDDFSRPHLTGSCRTEGFYKMDPREKLRTKYHLHKSGGGVEDMFTQAQLAKLTKAHAISREARSSQRRQLTVLGEDAIGSNLLSFNQLKFRRKQMTFGKSSIHDWGLFSLEDIGPDEMVIEYVGHNVRSVLSDVREKRYEKQGIGSSYLFRVDLDYVVDATKCGNLARFINHSCDPNCYAKVISVDGESKIVIYSKQPIAVGEEITYDYKFPIEDEKIVCLCGAKNCRKYLN